jgi:propionate catabolism operon transcriptional regulator
LPLQTRLLRVLEEREVVRVGGTRPIPVNVRIVSATHCDLDQRVKEGRFRADLFYRLGVLRLALPALRERTEDIVALAEWCLKNALAALGIRPNANLHAELAACAPVLGAYGWPGNVRELRNLMERLALFLALAPELGGVARPAKAAPLPVAVTEDVAQVLARYNGNREAAAKHLGISRTTLWRKLRDSP